MVHFWFRVQSSQPPSIHSLWPNKPYAGQSHGPTPKHPFRSWIQTWPLSLSLPLSPPGEKHPSSYRAPYSRIESANQSTTSSGESHFHIHSIAPRGTNWRGAIPRLFTDITISLSRITVDWFSVEAKSATVPRETGGWNGGAVGWEGSWKKRRKKDWKKKGERRKEGYKWERMEGDGGRGDRS